MTRRIRLTLLATMAAFVLLALVASNADAACLPDPPMNGDAVDCTGTDSTGYDASGATDLTITVQPGAELTDASPGLDSAILVSTGNVINIGLFGEATSLITVDGANGFGIRGGDDNGLTNNGTITINGLNGRGISFGSHTAGAPFGAVNNDVMGVINALADGSVAIEVGNDFSVRTEGPLNLTGDSTIGVSAGDRIDYSSIFSTLSNEGTINVDGANSFGIRAGDGWVAAHVIDPANPPEPTDASIINGLQNGFDAATSINVRGDDSYGIYAGHNSFAINLGIINVTGTNAIGVSLDGNDILDEANPAVGAFVSFHNIGRILGGPDAGPLVEFRSFDPSGDNKLLIEEGSQILADLTNANMVDRGIAIRATDGVDLVFNRGDLRGDVLFGDGDDFYSQSAAATLNGTLYGGAGTGDVAVLATNLSGVAQNFNVSALVDFEILRIGGGTAGWTLSNSGGFDGLAQIVPNGRLVVPTPITLGGALEVDPTGTIEVTLDGTTPPLTVVGASTFDGTLIVNAGPNLTDSLTPYRVIAANGGYTGLFGTIQVPTGGVRVFTPSYDANGVLVLVENLGLVGAARGQTQTAIAIHLDQIDTDGGGSQDVQDFIDQLEASTTSISSALIALSPEVYDVHTTVSVEGGRAVSNLLFDRPRECVAGDRDLWAGPEMRLPCRPRSWSPWIAALGSFRSREKFTEHPRYDVQLGGLAAGIDYRPIDSVDLTFAIASQRGTINVAVGGESTITLIDLMAQAAWTRGPLRVQGALGWGHGFHKDRRLIQESVTSTPVNVRGVTDHDSNRVSLAGEVGLSFDVGPVKVEPIAGIDWAFIDQGSIHEDEAGGFGIRIESRDDNTGSINTGVRLSTVYEHKRYIMHQLNWMDGVWRPQVDLQWRQILAGNNREIQARLEGAPSAVPDFTIKGKEDNGGFEIGAGVSFIPKHANRLQFDLRYDAYIASHTVAQNLVGRVLIGF